MAVLASSLGALIVASYSTYYGRRPVYLYALPVFVIGSAGVASAESIPSLLFWRFLQSMGASLGPVIGAAVIGDIFKLDERGSALGIFFAICLISTTFAPFAGGYITHYYSWRVVHGILCFVGLIGFATFYFLFPETSQPGARGIEKMNNPADGINNDSSKSSFKFINPLKPLWLLRSPSMLLTGIIVSASQIAVFVVAVPFPYTIGLRYHITNEALIGACLFTGGVGSMIGTPIVGRVSDHIVAKRRRQRKGIWYPEDRMRAAIIPFAVLVPVSVLCFGLVNKFEDGNMGLMLSLVLFFFYWWRSRNDLRNLCCVYDRRNAISKFRNLGSNQRHAFCCSCNERCSYPSHDLYLWNRRIVYTVCGTYMGLLWWTILLDPLW